MAEVPLGWNYNPAAWSQRAPVMALTFLVFGFSLFCLLGQLSTAPSIWAFMFHLRSELNSWDNVFLRAPELMVNTLGYFLLFMGSLLGGTGRWRTCPWLVVILSAFLVSLVVFDLVTPILELILLPTWSVPCVLLSLLSALLLGLSIDELLASLQHLKRARYIRFPHWRGLWPWSRAINSTD